MLYMVNPSEPPKKRKKGRRRNPELLIVNPYSLGDRKEKKMARTRKRRRRRRNPGLPTVAGLQASALGVLNRSNLEQAAWIGASGAVAMGVLSGRLGALIPTLPSVAGFNLTSLAVSLAVGVVTGVVGGVVAGFVPGQVGSYVSRFATAGAQGALIFGLASFLSPLTSRVTAAVPGSAGFGSVVKECFNLFPNENCEGRMATGYQGYEPAGRWIPNEFVRMDDVVPVLTEQQKVTAAKGTLGSYERLGDIYGSQRLGSFERESGFGEVVAEVDNYGIIPEGNQQNADTASLNAANFVGEGGGIATGGQGSAGFGSYSSYGNPLWS